MFISLVLNCLHSQVTEATENFWNLLETVLPVFLLSVLELLPWKVLGFVSFSPYLLFLCHNIISQSKFLGLSKVLLSLFSLVNCLSVLSVKVKATWGKAMLHIDGIIPLKNMKY